MALAGAASAACVGSTCSLGGQLRGQIGNGLPLPITLNPAGTGDLRWGQPGAIGAAPGATLQQQTPAPAGTPGTAPRSLMAIKPGLFTYDDPLVSIGVIKANIKVFAVQTNINLTNPHPGTTEFGATIPSIFPFSPNTLVAGGRTGAAVLSYCAGLPAPTASANPGCDAPDAFGFSTTTTAGGTGVTQPLSNGLVRYTATKNQFGGVGGSRVLGTAMVFFNAGGLAVGDLPCTIGTQPLCIAAVSLVIPGTGAVNGGAFAKKVTNPAFTTATGVFTANIGGNGTINSVGAIVKDTMGVPLPFTGQAATSWGFPGTTGKLTISVTQNEDAPTELETFTRTGGDNRTAGGEGIVVLVSGAVSSRSISGPNGNRGWATYNVPEPSAILAASAGMFALLGCHQLVRRRNR
jgi:hypothetical protein